MSTGLVSDEPGIARVLTTRDQTRATYDRIAPYYEVLEGFWERPARHAGLAALRPSPRESLLEVGCGPGRSLAEMALAVGPQGHVLGIDLAPRMCLVARRRLQRTGVTRQAEVVQADATQLPVASDRFDGVFMSFTLELFDTPQIPVVLAECTRVLRPGGRLVVVGLSKEGPASVLGRMYEWGHGRFPRVLDCRPIRVARSLTEANLRVRRARVASLWGLPVEVVLAVA
mgnify:CR=1 FL=1